jgi:hypothetical protein
MTCLAQHCGILRTEDLGAESNRRIDLRLSKRLVGRRAAAQTLDQ